MELIVWIILFLVSLTILVKSSDYFTDAAEKIGLYFGFPKFIVGVTIVAVGTSLPELISSIIAMLSNTPEIVTGNIVGSNITNIFLILGLASIIGKKISISYDLIHVDIPLFIASAFYLAITLSDGEFTTGEGLLALVAMSIYFIYAIKSNGNKDEIGEKIDEKLVKGKQLAKLMKKEEVHLEYFSILILVASTILIFISAKFVIDAVIGISAILNIGKEVIALSAVALGTSLPELVVNINAVRHGRGEIVIGSVLGSNIFNGFGIMGVSSLLGNIPVSESIIMFSIPMLIISTLLFFFKIHEKEITQWEGWILLIFYFFFIGKIFNLL